MRSDILRAVEDEFAARRARNRAEEERREAEVARRCPEVLRLREERQQLIYSGIRGMLQRQEELRSLPARMDEANRRIAAALREAGYPENYLDPIFDCPRCEDRGYTGEPVREMCTCMKEAVSRRLRGDMGLSEAAPQTFESWRMDIIPDRPLPGLAVTQRQLSAIVRTQCEEWANRWPDSPVQTVLLGGESGLGKTFLLHAMARRLLERGQRVMLLSAYRLLEECRRAWFGGDDSGLKEILACDVLLIDDLGAEPLMPNVTIEQIYHVLNERLTAGRATVISTNLTIEELKGRYTERIVSRLTDRTSALTVRLQGDDLRRAARG